MKKWMVLASLVSLPVFGTWISACGDDEEVRNDDPKSDGGTDGTTPTDGAGGDATDDDAGDAGPDGTAPGCPSTAGLPPRLLLVGGAANSELASFNMTSKAVEGRLPFSSFGAVASGTGPYLLQQGNDVVVKLDPNEPWKALSSWNVKSDDQFDGSAPYSNPAGIFVPTCTKGYVLRYNRNRIAVIDTTQTVDGGAPTSFIDLSSLRQAGDADGSVDMVSAVHVPSKNRLFVLLGNTDLTKAAADGYSLLCGATKPLIVAIDTTTDQLVSLNGTGPGGGIELPGYNPPINGGALWYDPALERLVVLQAGCNVDAGGGVAGAIQQREVDGVDLATGTASVLLDLNDRPFPSPLVYVDESRAAVGFFGSANFWNPKTNTLGGEIPGGLTAFAYAGGNKLVGARTFTQGDGGKNLEIVTVPFVDGGTPQADLIEKLGEGPFTDNAGYFLTNVEVWPKPTN